jgi:hypothetical protein
MDVATGLTLKPAGFALATDVEIGTMAKVQGEGDYESARRYNAKTRSFVKKAGKTATKRASGGVDQGALRKAKSKSKGGKQDARDAQILKTLVARKAKKTGTRARAR